MLISAILLSVLLLGMLALIPGCGTSPSTASEPDVTSTPDSSSSPQSVSQIDTYTIADSTGDWGFPSPYGHYSRGPGYMRMQFIFETLVWKDNDSIEPQLASSWEYIESDQAYLFHLRQDVKWQDGHPFTADDVIFTYDYTMDHPYAWVDNTIVKSAEKLDDYTVELYLNKTYSSFLQGIAGTQPILPEHIWENVADPTTYTSPEAAIGTGPYKLADYNKAQGTYRYVANDNYYMGRPVANEIRFIKLSENMNAAALEDGTVDAATAPAELVEKLKSEGFRVQEDVPSWCNKLTINHNKEPLFSQSFRQALAYAIDRDQMVQIVLRGVGLAGSAGLVPQTSVWYNPDTPRFEYNPQKATELIESLGYVKQNGYFYKDGQPLTLSLIAASDYKDEGQYVTNALETVGIHIDFQTLEGTTVDNKVAAWDFDLSLYGHGGLFDPVFLYQVILGSGFNSARFDKDPELNQLLDQLIVEMNEENKKDLVDQIQTRYAEDMPAITLYYHIAYMAYDSKVNLYYTMDGVGSGVPIALNRMCFVQ